MRIVREHGMRQEEAFDLVVEKLPSLLEVLIKVVEEATWSEEGILWAADNYWSTEFLDEQEPQADDDICKMCGQQVIVLDEGLMSNGLPFSIYQCSCCGNARCPHQHQQNGV